MLAQAAQELLYLTGTAVHRAFFAVLVLTVRCFYPHGLFVRRRKPLTAKYNTTLPQRGTSQGGKSRRLHIFTAKRSLATSLLMRRRPEAAVIPQRVYRMCCIAGLV